MVVELPNELLDCVLQHSSLFDLHSCRRVCATWMARAIAARNARRVLAFDQSYGGKKALGQAKSLHPCVRGKQMFKADGVCSFGGEYLLVADTGRHRLMVVRATDSLIIYDRFGGGYSSVAASPYPLECARPLDVVHCRMDERDVVYVVDNANGRVRRLYAAEIRFADSEPVETSTWINGNVDSQSWTDAGCPAMLSGSFKSHLSINPADNFTPRPATFFGWFDDTRSSRIADPKGLALDLDENELYVSSALIATNRYANAVIVLDARTLQRKRSFEIQGDGSGIVARASPEKIVLHRGDVYVQCLAWIHVYSRQGLFLRAFPPHALSAPLDAQGGLKSGIKLSPEAALDEHWLPRSIALHQVGGVDRMLVTTAHHVHVLSLPDGEPRQILAVPDSGYLGKLCVHGDKVYVCDMNQAKMHVLRAA